VFRPTLAYIPPPPIGENQIVEVNGYQFTIASAKERRRKLLNKTMKSMLTAAQLGDIGPRTADDESTDTSSSTASGITQPSYKVVTKLEPKANCLSNNIDNIRERANLVWSKAAEIPNLEPVLPQVHVTDQALLGSTKEAVATSHAYAQESIVDYLKNNLFMAEISNFDVTVNDGKDQGCIEIKSIATPEIIASMKEKHPSQSGIKYWAVFSYYTGEFYTEVLWKPFEALGRQLKSDMGAMTLPTTKAKTRLHVLKVLEALGRPLVSQITSYKTECRALPMTRNNVSNGLDYPRACAGNTKDGHRTMVGTHGVFDETTELPTRRVRKHVRDEKEIRTPGNQPWKTEPLSQYKPDMSGYIIETIAGLCKQSKHPISRKLSEAIVELYMVCSLVSQLAHCRPSSLMPGSTLSEDGIDRTISLVKSVCPHPYNYGGKDILMTKLKTIKRGELLSAQADWPGTECNIPCEMPTVPTGVVPVSTIANQLGLTGSDRQFNPDAPVPELVNPHGVSELDLLTTVKDKVDKRMSAMTAPYVEQHGHLIGGGTAFGARASEMTLPTAVMNAMKDGPLTDNVEDHIALTMASLVVTLQQTRDENTIIPTGKYKHVYHRSSTHNMLVNHSQTYPMCRDERADKISNGKAAIRGMMPNQPNTDVIKRGGSLIDRQNKGTWFLKACTTCEITGRESAKTFKPGPIDWSWGGANSQLHNDVARKGGVPSHCATQLSFYLGVLNAKWRSRANNPRYWPVASEDEVLEFKNRDPQTLKYMAELAANLNAAIAKNRVNVQAERHGEWSLGYTVNTNAVCLRLPPRYEPDGSRVARILDVIYNDISNPNPSVCEEKYSGWRHANVTVGMSRIRITWRVSEEERFTVSSIIQRSVRDVLGENMVSSTNGCGPYPVTSLYNTISRLASSRHNRQMQYVLDANMYCVRGAGRANGVVSLINDIMVDACKFPESGIMLALALIQAGSTEVRPDTISAAMSLVKVAGTTAEANSKLMHRAMYSKAVEHLTMSLMAMSPTIANLGWWDMSVKLE